MSDDSIISRAKVLYFPLLLMLGVSGCGLHSTDRWKSGNANYRFCTQGVYKLPIPEMIQEMRDRGMAQYMAPHLDAERNSSGYKSIRWINDVNKLKDIIRNNRLVYSGMDLNKPESLEERYRRYSAEMQLLRIHPLIRRHAYRHGFLLLDSPDNFVREEFAVGTGHLHEDKFFRSSEDKVGIKYERYLNTSIVCSPQTWDVHRRLEGRFGFDIHLIPRKVPRNAAWVRSRMHFLDMEILLDWNYERYFDSIKDIDVLRQYLATAYNERGKRHAARRLSELKRKKR